MRKEEKFRNQASKRFYDFFRKLIDAGTLSHQDLADAFGVYQSNPSNFLNNLKNGSASVTVDQIETAKKEFGLRADQLFMDSLENRNNVAEEPKPVYGIGMQVTTYEPRTDVAIGSRIGGVLKGLLQKHKVSIDPYCRESLHISRQYLYNMFRGDARLPFEMAIKICEDLGESLDVFRSTPLPMGHIQTELELTRLRLEECLREKKPKNK
jgi:plasmid maintenance system antidote protein VapI